MPDWEGLRHLAALARGGTLTAAAKALRVEHATVGRRIAALESELGLKLVDRRGKKVLLTPEGERVARVAQRMEDEAHEAERLALASRQEVSGTVILSLPPAFAAARLMAPLVQLQKRHPGLTLQVVGEAREASLGRREADIAVRLSRPQDGDLAAAKLGEMAFHFYASPDYLANHRPEDWCFIANGDSSLETPQNRRLEAFAAGRPMRLLANTTELRLAAAKAGAGIALLPDFLAGSSPDLQRIDVAGEVLKREVWLVMHADLRTAPIVRIVADCLKAAMAPPFAG